LGRKKHTESGSLSPSDDEENNHTDDQPTQKSGIRPILPRMTMPLTVPAITMSVIPPITLNTSLNGHTTLTTEPNKASILIKY
jgi:hypothetical protein